MGCKTALVISKTPLRVSFGGGGTDLREFYGTEFGAVTGMTIDKYVYIAVNRRFDRGVRFSYSRTENVACAAELKHPIAREALNLLGIEQGVEIVSVADIPAGTGLGSSSSFTVGLLGALHAFLEKPVPPSELAAEACHIEIDRLGDPIGKQDQYLCAHGGMLHLRFDPDEGVAVEEIACAPQLLSQLREGLLLFYTGTSRKATAILGDQAAVTRGGQNREQLRQLREIALALRDLLSAGGGLAEFGLLLDAGWQCKRQLSNLVSTPEIDARYASARAAGALGGKLVGAGGGGFLLLCCPPGRRAAVGRAVGLSELRFRFEPTGTSLHYLR